ncbi:MAG: hypothetical protein Ct9H300mP6_01700 [Gammaproteobacteria bacterium]|nr:MAG: hypothetical protein Ct9H300mP6_01700 [Gammaproteobacteria bacterium]
MNQRSTFIFTMLCFGFAFLYIPIVLVIIYSFNDSKLVTFGAVGQLGGIWNSSVMKTF